MTTIPKQFTKKGFEHRQIFREGNIAVFERKHTAGTIEHYEVVQIHHHKAYTIAGQNIEAGEHYPSSGTWGTYGFTFSDREKAIARAVEMTRKAAA